MWSSLTPHKKVKPGGEWWSGEGAEREKEEGKERENKNGYTTY